MISNETPQQQEEKHRRFSLDHKLIWIAIIVLFILVGTVISFFLITQTSRIEQELDLALMNNEQATSSQVLRRIREKLDGYEEQDVKEETSSFQIPGTKHYLSYSAGWHIALQEAFLTEGGAIDFGGWRYNRRIIMNREPIVFPEIYEFGSPWDITILYDKFTEADEVGFDSILDQARAKFFDIDEKKEELAQGDLSIIAGKFGDPEEEPLGEGEVYLLNFGKDGYFIGYVGLNRNADLVNELDKIMRSINAPKEVPKESTDIK